MKNSFLVISLITFFSSGVFAQEQEPAQSGPTEQQVLVYKVVCSSNDELVADQALLDQIGQNEQMTEVRESFQTFATNPASVISSVLNQYDAMKSQAVEMVLAQIPADDLQAAAEQQAQASGISVDDAKTQIIEQQANLALQQATGQPVMSRNDVIVQLSIESCSLNNIIASQVAEKGCKTPAGEELNLSAANQFCDSVSTQIETIKAVATQLGSIQQEIQQTIRLVTQQLQMGAQARMAPLLQSIETPQQEIVDVVTSLIDAQTTPTTEVPLAPVAVPEQN